LGFITLLNLKNILSYLLLSLTLINCGGGGSSGSDPVVTLDSISINVLSQHLKINDTFQLIATGTFSDISNVNISDQVNWVSSDTNVFTVSNTGLIAAVSAGSATITATLNTQSANTSATAIDLVEISISPASVTLAIDSFQNFVATGKYSDNSTEDLTTSVSWSTDDLVKATITSTGILTAVSAGTSQVTASINSLSHSVSVTIPIRLESIVLNALPNNLKLNDTFQLIATGTFSDASSVNISDQVNWISSDTNVFTVSNTGLIAAVSAGSATITAALNAQSANTSATAIDLVEINISPTSVTLAIDSSQNFVATGRYTDNTTEDLTNSVSWSTDNPAKATITSSGKLTAMSAGTSQVSANLNSLSGTSLSNTVSVTISAATLKKIDIVGPSSLAAGVTDQLSAIGTFSDGSTQDITSDLSWQSSASSIASINAQTALLTSIQQGNIVITATNSTLSATLNVTISPASLTALSMSPSTISLAKGSNKEVTITAFYSDQSFVDVSNQVSWVSSDSTIATAQGNTAIVEGHSVGSNTLTASFSGMNATLTVNVSNATLSSLSILPKSISLSKGLNQAFSVTGIYSDGSVQNLTQQVTWLSSDNNLGAISNAIESKGIADAIEIGAVTISASLGSISASTTLTIKNSQLSSIEITPSSSQVANGVSVQASAIGTYSDGTQVDITQLVQWESNATTIAKASTSVKGLIETFSTGQALISANLNAISALSQVTVSAATLQSINISSSIQTLPKGSEVVLTATGSYSDNSTNDISHQVTWISSDDLILTVDNTSNGQSVVGLVRATNIGTAAITANFNGLSANVNLIVSDAVLTQITISSITSTINIHSNTQASAIATFSDASTLDMTQQVNWLSSNPTLASVNQLQDNGGLVKGLAQGSFQLSASLKGVSSNSLTITVNSNPNAPSRMTLSLLPNVILNDNSDTSQVQVTLIPESESGVIADGSSVSFNIDEGGNTRTETATTVNGIATLNLTSLFDGLISVQASVNSDVTANGGLLSTPSFSNAIVAEGRSNAIFANNILAKGSVFLVLLRNISNREFNIPAIFITRGPDNAPVNLPDSPVTNTQFTNGGILSGGAYAVLGYSLDTDISDNVLRIIYDLSDTPTGVNFLSGIAFAF